MQVYLEKQTDSIVQAIQTLLYAMRQTSVYGDEFKDTVSGITTIVDNLITVTRGTIGGPNGGPYKDRGENILDDLGDANATLENLGDSMVKDPQSRSLKQKLASSSYEIAKVKQEI